MNCLLFLVVPLFYQFLYKTFKIIQIKKTIQAVNDLEIPMNNTQIKATSLYVLIKNYIYSRNCYIICFSLILGDEKHHVLKTFH